MCVQLTWLHHPRQLPVEWMEIRTSPWSVDGEDVF